MLDCYVKKEAEKHPIPIQVVPCLDFEAWLKNQSSIIKKWVSATNFTAKPGTACYVVSEKGELTTVLLGIIDKNDVWGIGVLPLILKPAVYVLENQFPAELYELAAVAWGLGYYQFSQYRKTTLPMGAKLLLSDASNMAHISNTVRATYLVRDLINTPTDDLGPAELAEAAISVAEEFGAKTRLIIGDDLLKKNYPAIHAVGRASVNAPRLIEFHWGKKSDPQVTLVGKGVCFDSGGLDIKPASGMRYMKKDMAGAAHVLGLAQMIMAANLPLHLRVLIPAVENVISGDALHPGDVIKMRNGLCVEVTNTDAEGRLILADALTDAASQEPDLIIDIATLTGAARVALGSDVGALFTPDDAIAEKLQACSHSEQDPLWRMPLYRPYRILLESTVADLCNADLDSVGGGAIVAALFLSIFVPETKWLHLDIMAYNLRYQPSRPIGGEAMGLRALYRYLVETYCP